MTTQTRAVTQSMTLTKVVYVTRKVQADLFSIVDTYGQITEEYAQKLIHDLRVLLDEEVVERVSFLWTIPGTKVVVGAYSYRVIASGVGLADDRSGGIRFDRALGEAKFGVRVFYSSRWKRMDEAEREAIRNTLDLRWGPGGTLDYSRGSWRSEKTYSMAGYGLGRDRFGA